MYDITLTSETPQVCTFRHLVLRDTDSFSRTVYGVLQCRAIDPIYPPPIGLSGLASITSGPPTVLFLPASARSRACVHIFGWME